MPGQGLRILSVFGTRPEAIKMAPVVRALEAMNGIDSLVCVTGQHREMLRQVLDLFEIVPDANLDLMRSGQGLGHITQAVLTGVGACIEQYRPDWVLVHGDTTTSMSAALAAFYSGVPVGHVEAGLRTYNMTSPWPEEANRQITGRLAALHFAPTAEAEANLLAERVPAENVVVTGNTVIDALHEVRRDVLTRPEIARRLERQFGFLDKNKRLILVTGHRRENFDGGLDRVCHALKALAGRGDVQVVYPVHLNPAVLSVAQGILTGVPGVRLIEPQDYLPFVWLMGRASLIVTDSGGIQEEAPSLGKPVLVTRDTTERPEAVAAGTVRLVGTDSATIVEEVARLLDDAAAYGAMAQAHNPYGDGRSAARIAGRFAQSGLQAA